MANASILVILNPTAGRGFGGRIESTLQDYLTEYGASFEIVRTQGVGHAIELAAEAARNGYELIVAAGGDGTSNEVVNGLVQASDEGHSGTMGVLPIGSGSDFAHAVGVSPDLRQAASALLAGETRWIDVGRVTLDGRESRYFDNTVGLGFDAIVTYEARKVKLLRGMALYLPVVLKTVFLYGDSPTITVSYNGMEVVQPAMMVTVANGPREGGGFFVAPDARPDDGLFDVCITRQMGRLQTLKMIPHFMNGTHVGLEPVTMAQTEKVTITADGDFLVHADGEMLSTACRRMDLEILPKRIQVRS